MTSAAHATQLTLLFRAPPASAGELLERLRELGLRDVTTCRLTRNRNVMVSYRGSELRVHEGYLGAADHVLAALVLFVQARRRADRLAARRTLLAHPIDAGRGRARRRDTMHPDDAGAAQRFQEWHARYNAQFFGGALREIPVRVSRRMRARLGHYSVATDAGDPAEIAISRRHLRRHGWDEALQTLLHEMVHQWQDETGLPLDHRRDFRRKAREIGISPFACRKVA
jgi:hypothetical protein